MSNVKYNLPFSLGISDTPNLDNIDPKLRGTITEIYNAFQQLQLAIHNYLGVGQQLKTMWSQLGYANTLHLSSPTRFYAQCTENIAYGAAINLFTSGGLLKARNANATNNTKQAHGFCTVVGGILLGDYGEFILFHGLLTGFVGLTQGTRYFLSTVNGLITAVAPVAAGNIEQPLGIAMDSTALLYDFGLGFIQH